MIHFLNAVIFPYRKGLVIIMELRMSHNHYSGSLKAPKAFATVTPFFTLGRTISQVGAELMARAKGSFSTAYPAAPLLTAGRAILEATLPSPRQRLTRPSKNRHPTEGPNMGNSFIALQSHHILWWLLAVSFLALLTIALLLILLRRKAPDSLADVRLRMELVEKGQERLEKLLREEMGRNREEATAHFRQHREELSRALTAFGNSLLSRMAEISGLQKNQLDSFARQLSTLTESNEKRLETMKNAVEARLKDLQEDNSRQLERMRTTVDEKLQGTLEKRLGESFRQVSERLEQVHKGLGEMQTLASGVGDLKKALTNVKTRGVWGEIQLEALLEEILAPEQYERNVKPREHSGEVVEFALRLPGHEDGDGKCVWLPIDAKFPLEDYQRLVEAQEKGDTTGAEAAAKMLEARIKACARDISEKYIHPPATTDFGIMFLPTEGLYAEVARRTAVLEVIQREHRVVVAGPTTFAALLNSLQMGFRTLAIQKRSSEVWKLLGAVKSEFGKFGDILDGVRKKLEQASNTMESAARRSRAIERKLRGVQELPSSEDHLFLENDRSEDEFPVP